VERWRNIHPTAPVRREDASPLPVLPLRRPRLSKLALLTPRGRRVLREVAAGRLNKQVAFDLGISEITVKLHRGNVMRKMQFTSVGEFIRVWEALPAEVRRRVEA
jgi:DNA-binding NarL/FixJ family response regulator